MFDLNQFQGGVIDLVGGATTIVLALAGNFIRRQNLAAKLATAERIARIAVPAVEQMGRQNHWDGRQKLDNALAQCRAIAAQHGVNLDDPTWRSFIEREVEALNAFNLEIMGAGANAAPAAAPAPVVASAINVPVAQ